jgi:hypothetical protein
MDNVEINTSKTVSITLPSDPDSNSVTATLYHEFGDTVSGPTAATRTGAGVYQITYGQSPSGEFVLNSCGKYRVDFSFKISATSYKRSIYFNVYTPYSTDVEFFTEFPELELENSAKFNSVESKIRNIINTYCGQSFDPFFNKTIVLNGNNHHTLHLPFPLSVLRKVTLNIGEEDETVLYDSSISSLKNIEKVHQPFNFESTYYIRFKTGALTGIEGKYDVSKFKEEASYSVVGDWGWLYVPEPVKQAANLLIADYFNTDSEYRRHGIYEVDMDILKLRMGENFYASTGNIDADTLLMDYTLFVMDYII